MVSHTGVEKTERGTIPKDNTRRGRRLTDLPEEVLEIVLKHLLVAENNLITAVKAPKQWIPAKDGVDFASLDDIHLQRQIMLVKRSCTGNTLAQIKHALLATRSYEHAIDLITAHNERHPPQSRYCVRSYKLHPQVLAVCRDFYRIGKRILYSNTMEILLRPGGLSPSARGRMQSPLSTRAKTTYLDRTMDSTIWTSTFSPGYCHVHPQTWEAIRRFVHVKITIEPPQQMQISAMLLFVTLLNEIVSSEMQITIALDSLSLWHMLRPATSTSPALLALIIKSLRYCVAKN